MKVEYPAKIEKDETGKFFVSFPDIAEALTEGATLEEALFNASEALSLALEYRIDEKQAIHEPSTAKARNVYMIAPDAKVQSALLIRRSRADRSLADLARTLETSWPAVQRLENPRHSPSLKMLNRAASALGKRLVLSFE